MRSNAGQQKMWTDFKCVCSHPCRRQSLSRNYEGSRIAKMTVRRRLTITFKQQDPRVKGNKSAASEDHLGALRNLEYHKVC